ncbi:MAG TPA: hypothetical protein VGM23_12400 [Armatimonadota bacterium]
MPSRVLGVLLLTIIAALAVRADQFDNPVPQALQHGPSPEVSNYQKVERTEIYRLRIVNDTNGEIAGSLDSGKSWQTLGHVTHYTEKVTNQGYTASKWAPIGAVAATAVNAIHIRTGYNAKDDKGIVFSLLPRELTSEAGIKLASFLSPDASIYTDIPGGTGIFGGHWAPILGNPVYLEQAGALQRMPDGYVPHRGDVLTIPVMEAVDAPQEIIFENRFGGFITLVDWDDHATVIGQVLKPVAGVGRFTGSQYTGVGRLRANHNGVICVSVSPAGTIGGFQILPREHAMSPEMVRARTMTQWMVVGPLDARDTSWEGVAPLFFGYLRPSWSDDDWAGPDWLRKVTGRTLVDVRIKNGPWQPMPSYQFDPDLNKPLPDWCMTALQDVTHIRINLPVPKRLQMPTGQK